MENNTFKLKEVSITAKTCGNCHFWIGRCLKGKLNMLCCSLACESFELKKGGEKT